MKFWKVTGRVKIGIFKVSWTNFVNATMYVAGGGAGGTFNDSKGVCTQCVPHQGDD